MEGKSKVDANLSDALGIVPAVVGEILPVSQPPARAQPPEEEKEPSVHVKEMEKDFAEARDGIKRTLLNSEKAIKSILEVAQESGEPRAYEVLAQMIGMALEANTKLMHLHKQAKDIRKEGDAGQPQKIVNNNSIFVGNTAELQKLVKDMRKRTDDAAQAG
jgi:hypothetical protein